MEAIHTAAPGSEIQVYAPFPHAVALDADLYIDPANWRWVHCLHFPLETLDKLQFSQRPYKWIRYATGAVTGARGDLSLSHDSLDIVDYDGVLPQESVVLYYHTSDEEKRRMFPADPYIGRTDVTSSVSTSRRDQFSDDLLRRDERRCVLSNLSEEFSDAVHLVAHSKGDAVCYHSLPHTRSHIPSQWRQYILNYTQHRSREPNGNDILSDIDSIRNGLLLNKFTHVVLGKHVAFLKVCDDYMTHNQSLMASELDP